MFVASKVTVSGSKPLPMSSVCAWFNRDVLSSRLSAAIARAFLLHLIGLYLVLVLSSLLTWPLAPLSVVFTSFKTLMAPSSWLYILLASSSLAGFTWSSFKRLCLAASMPSHTAVHIATLVLDPWSAGHLAIVALCSAVAIRSYIGLLAWPYATLMEDCAPGSSSRCLSEPHIFLILAGLFSGMLVGWDIVRGNVAILSFPLIPCKGLAQLKLKLKPMTLQASSFAGRSLKWYCLVYALIGK